MVKQVTIDIHGQLSRQDYWLRRLEADTAIPNANKDVVKEFLHKQRVQNIKIDTLVKKLQKLYELSRMLGEKEWRKLSEKDIEALIETIALNGTWSNGGKVMRLGILRNFLYWLGYDPQLIQKNVKIKNEDNTKLPEELLTEEEIQKLINTATLPRERALISLLADTGARVSELGRMRVKNVAWEADGAVINIPSGKTGARRVRLMWSMHALRYWLNQHPKVADADFLEAPLWADRKGSPQSYVSMNHRLWKIAKRAGIKKKVNPHAFRHYHATQLAKLGLNEAQMCARLGWRLGSKMPRVYIHLAGADTDAALYRAYGIDKAEKKQAIDNGEKKQDINKQEEKQAEPVTTPICPRCCKENNLGDQFCHHCGMPLDLNVAVRQDDKMQELLEYVSRLKEVFEKDAELKTRFENKLAQGSRISRA